jgi:DNA-binding transcriptional ArsR family regulator
MKARKLNCALENLSPEAVGSAADVLRTLAHPMRLRIIDLLHTADELPVCGNHMKRVGLIRSERRGKEVWYSVSDPRPIALLNCICTCCRNNV